MNRRRFLRVIGGTAIVLGGGAVGLSRCDRMPAEAIEGWNGPDPTETDYRRRALAYALLAPNPHNMQSWIVDLHEPDAVTFHVDRTRLLPDTDPFSRQIMIGCGTFLELACIAASHDGYRAQVTYFPAGAFPADQVSDAPYARVEFTKDASLAADPLFAQTLKRRSNKKEYDGRAVEPAHFAALKAEVPVLNFAAEAGQVARLRALADEAYRIEVATPRTYKESVDRMRIGADAIAAHRDGLFLHGPLFWWLKRLGLMSSEEMMRPGSAAHDSALGMMTPLFASTPNFGWMTTADNSRETQIETGRAYLRFNLKATELGVAIHPNSQALQEYAEMTDLQRRFLAELGTPAGHTVQMFVRMGYGEEVEKTPRRRLADVVRA